MRESESDEGNESDEGEWIYIPEEDKSEVLIIKINRLKELINESSILFNEVFELTKGDELIFEKAFDDALNAFTEINRLFDYRIHTKSL